VTKVVPGALEHAPALIEAAMPVQRLSVEAHREQEGKQGKMLTTLGSYWKGRKPLILNRACILGCLLPATQDLAADLEVFELLLGMDDDSLSKRLGLEEGSSLPAEPFRDLVAKARRPEELSVAETAGMWTRVNAHLGTDARSIAELVGQLGVMRYGHRPRVADAFAGSGQIPFAAAQVGCDVIASDLNPIACMLTWASFRLVGGSASFRSGLEKAQQDLVDTVQRDLDELGVEADGKGWRPKTLLYCLEARCPETGWFVPLLSTRLISKGKAAVADLVPNPAKKAFDIVVRSGVSAKELTEAERGTVRTDGRGQDPYLCYVLDGTEHRTKIATLRGDHEAADGTNANKLRPWKAEDFRPSTDDIFQERLYAIQWMRPKNGGKANEYEFRAVSDADREREARVERYVENHIREWQANGLIPDMRIEPGDKTDEPIRTRGWTHWHHLFAPRQLLFLGLASKHIRARNDEYVAPLLVFLARLADWSSKLCRYGTGAARESVAQTFYNQALNTLFTYGVRSFAFAKTYLLEELAHSPVAGPLQVACRSAESFAESADIFVTDPPYGDAVKYEEILEFFIAWLRKNPPPEFAGWTWDSRRALAIKGEDEGFRRGMVAAYRAMAERMPDNGMQVIMFTHQSGSIWADMANIVWASGLHVTAAWYVVTETDSALREGSYVKGTVLLVLRKRGASERTTRDDLAWELKEEVEEQVATLTGLNQRVSPRYRDENLFADADLQMAGYAAALRVLTRYAVIDGKEMSAEAIRPRVRGEKTFVDELIEFAVGVANEALAPRGIEKSHWDKLRPAERFYCKLLELEAQGHKTLDNYQNFAKAFKVRDFKPFLASHKANAARLKGATEFGRAEMSDGSELASTPLRATLYALMELQKGVDGGDVLTHMSHNVDGFFDANIRAILVELAEYLANKLAQLRPEEASAARVLRELLKNQRM